MGSVVDALKDANPKIVVTALSCIEIFINEYYNLFQSLGNLLYESLLLKFTDVKNNIRIKSVDLMVSFINIYGLTSGFDKLCANLNHKNYRIREHVLLTMSKLCDVYGDDIIVVPNLATKVSNLLGDAQLSIRQTCVTILLKLYGVYGEIMVDDLENNGVKPAYIKIVQDAIQNGVQTPTTTQESDNGMDSDDDNGVIVNIEQHSAHKTKLQTPTSRISLNATTPVISASKNKIESSSADDDNKIPANLLFLGILHEGVHTKPTKIYSDKDLGKLFSSIVEGLNKSDDWEARIVALQQLQALAYGDGTEYDTFLSYLKGCHELISAQISDLRSAVSKEACKTVSILALKMSQQFAQLAEFWLPVLMKQVPLKVAIMASAADRCLRSIMLAGSIGNGYPKILLQLFETCNGKTPVLRVRCLEYLIMVCSFWKLETLDKYMIQLKSVIINAIADADQHARKTGRQLYWVLRSRDIQWTTIMDNFLLELEPLAQKHILTEMQSNSIELQEILDLAKYTDKINFDLYLREPTLFVNSNIFEGSNSSNKTLALTLGTKAAPTRAASVPKSRNNSNNSINNNVSATINNSNKSALQISVSSIEAGSISNTNQSSELSNPLSTSTVFGQALAGRIAAASAKKLVGPKRIIVPNNNNAVEIKANIPITTNVANELPMSDDVFTRTHVISTPRLSIAPETHMVSEDKGTVNKPVSTVTINPGITTAIPNQISTSTTNVGRMANGPVRVIKKVVVSEPIDSFQPPSAPTVTTDSTDIQLNDNNNADRTYSLEALKRMIDDSYWGTRMMALDSINSKLNKCKMLSDSSIANNVVEAYIEMALAHISDSHQKVATESLQVIRTCIESFIHPAIALLSNILTALFHRLADNRTPVRDQANAILNSVRSSCDAVTIITSLSPKITEIPERMKTAVMQYLVVIVPHCGAYFSQSSNSWAFLGRMANVLGSSGSKPSSNLMLAGKRLLELVYNTAPSVVCCQLASLPLQQQSLLKKLLESAVPDIDMLVLAAGREDWKKGQDRILMRQQNSRTITELQVNTDLTSKTLKNVANQSTLPTPIIPKQSTSQIVNKDITWLLNSLRYDVNVVTKNEAVVEVIKLAKLADDNYWTLNCAQIVTLLLESFNPALMSSNNSNALTGLSPNHVISSNSRTAAIGVENECGNVGSDSATHETKSGYDNVNESCSGKHFESMHLSCKALLAIVRNRGTNIKYFMELLVTRLCQQAPYSPIAITLHCEQILADLASNGAQRLIKIALPFTLSNDTAASANVQLFAIHAITAAIKHMTSPELLKDIDAIITSILPSLSSTMVHLRKAVIFLLVEMYLVIGDALYPHVQELAAPQRKLLTIYIQKQVENKSESEKKVDII